MKFTQGILTLVAVVLLSTFACEMPEPKVDMEAEKKAIDSTVQQTALAVEDKDRTTLEELTTAELSYFQNGKIMDLDQFMESLKISENYNASLAKKDLWVSENGKMAVYTLKDEFTVTLKGKDWPPTTALMTIVLVKEADEWKIKHMHRSLPLPEPPAEMEKDMEGKDTMMKEKETEME